MLTIHSTFVSQHQDVRFQIIPPFVDAEYVFSCQVVSHSHDLYMLLARQQRGLENVLVMRETRFLDTFVLLTPHTNCACCQCSENELQCPSLSSPPCSILSQGRTHFYCQTQTSSLLQARCLRRYRDVIPCFSRRRCKLAPAPLQSGSSSLSTSI